ncbi:MAG: 1-acyl-sn-glycerol-3-phosphate acyltransferase [bacterium]|nr:1-acyl-sn-glycerol-3-phosphate acyltransferase [bacterium]
MTKILGIWSSIIETLLAKTLLGMKISVLGDMLRGDGIIPAAENEIIICLGNHPSTLLMPCFISFITQMICGDIIVLGKREHLANPFIGWYMKFAGTGLFIDQDSNEVTTAAIKKDLAGLLRKPLAIIIFPDSHRPDEELIAEDKKKFAVKIPDLNEWLHYTLVPRSGALFTLLHELKDHNVRIINITTACSVEDDSIWKLTEMIGSSVLIEPKEVRSIPYENRGSLNRWLNIEWAKKNNDIARWRQIMGTQHV